MAVQKHDPTAFSGDSKFDKSARRLVESWGTVESLRAKNWDAENAALDSVARELQLNDVQKRVLHRAIATAMEPNTDVPALSRTLVTLFQAQSAH